MDVIVCKKCGKKYGYEIYGPSYPGCKDREEAFCPYCGEVGYSTMTSRFISVTKIENDEEVEKDTKQVNEDE